MLNRTSFHTFCELVFYSLTNKTNNHNMNHKISVLTTDGQQLSGAEFIGQSKRVEDIVGIILQTDVIGVIISLDHWTEKWGEYGTQIFPSKNWAQIQMDLSGYDLTKTIVEAQTNIGMTAAKRCWSYDKADLQWYLPSAYELTTIAAYRAEIRRVMKKIGVPDNLLMENEGYFWSSSEINSNYAVSVYFSDGSLGSTGKNYSYYVRAVSAFKPLNPFNSSHCKRSAQCAFDSSILSNLSDDELLAEFGKRGFVGEIYKDVNNEL